MVVVVVGNGKVGIGSAVRSGTGTGSTAGTGMANGVHGIGIAAGCTAGPTGGRGCAVTGAGGVALGTGAGCSVASAAAWPGATGATVTSGGGGETTGSGSGGGSSAFVHAASHSNNPSPDSLWFIAGAPCVLDS